MSTEEARQVVYIFKGLVCALAEVLYRLYEVRHLLMGKGGIPEASGARHHPGARHVPYAKNLVWGDHTGHTVWKEMEVKFDYRHRQGRT